MTARTLAPVTAEQAAVIRQAHYALAARGRGKSGVHTTTDARRVIRSLLDVLASLTGIDSEALPFGGEPAGRSSGTPGNTALAEELLAEARPLMARRRALLRARDALRSTASTGAARCWRRQAGPAEVRDEASAIITALRAVRRTP